MKTCFVVSPIGGEGTDIRKRADQVFKYIIEPVCQKCDFKAIRVDQLNQSDSITQTIIDQLAQAELVVADITGHNPNAFYEMGYRACTGKPMIHLKQKDEAIPFDIANIRTFEYDLTDLDSVASTKGRLAQTIKSFNIQDSSNLQNGEIAESTSNNSPDTDASQLLPVLYTIQDQITQLKEEIHNKDTETIQTIIRASQPSLPAEDANTAIMKALLPELIKDPKNMRNLLQISEMIKKNGDK